MLQQRQQQTMATGKAPLVLTCFLGAILAVTTSCASLPGVRAVDTASFSLVELWQVLDEAANRYVSTEVEEILIVESISPGSSQGRINELGAFIAKWDAISLRVEAAMKVWREKHDPLNIQAELLQARHLLEEVRGLLPQFPDPQLPAEESIGER